MASSSPPSTVRRVSSCSVKPLQLPKEAQEPLHLAAWDHANLIRKYIQSGLLFSKPNSPSSSSLTMPLILDTLKTSLSHALVHFYPLAGRLATAISDDESKCHVYIDSSNAPGAEFIHAVADDVTVDDILSPVHIPPIVKSFFLYGEAANHDGHTLPLFAVQVTELVDGFFVGCTFNHTVADGTSFWHFFNQWSEISRLILSSKPMDNDIGNVVIPISRPPFMQRFYLESNGPIIKIPVFDINDVGVERGIPTGVVERVLHFSAESLAKIKAKSNSEINSDDTSTPVNPAAIISTFQSLCALIWIAVSKARHTPLDQPTLVLMLINNRSRMNPPLSPQYFGNCAYSVFAYTRAGELQEGGIGRAAKLLNEKVQAHTDKEVMQKYEEFVKEPKFKKLTVLNSLVFSGSIRFDAYQDDFGWGKPLALRNGLGSKFDGKVATYAGRDGGGSAEVMACFSPETMAELERDEEFMSFVS